MTWVSIEDARDLRQLGGQATATRMGVAICGQGTRSDALSMGQRVGPASAVASAARPESRSHARSRRDVDAHPKGASPFGVMDMVGNVWQWTEEFIDEHTRSGNPEGRQPLSAARLDLVLSPGLRN